VNRKKRIYEENLSNLKCPSEESGSASPCRFTGPTEIEAHYGFYEVDWRMF
jgi:hypothetical protein